jgi:hypothetical protein
MCKNVEGSNMKIRTNVRAGIADTGYYPRCGATTRCGGGTRCGGSTTYAL